VAAERVAWVAWVWVAWERRAALEREVAELQAELGHARAASAGQGVAQVGTRTGPVLKGWDGVCV
jgi:hypothetical protein